MEAGITVSPTFWEQFGAAMYQWKMYRLGNVGVTHHHKHHRGFIARKFHAMKRFMHKSYKYVEEEFYGEFVQN